MINPYKRLHDKGIIGINARNVMLISALNSRRNMKLVNDKTITKSLAQRFGIPTPEFYGKASTSHECQTISHFIHEEKGGVIKPAQGAQGKGILIVTQREGDLWRLGNDRLVRDSDLTYHAINVISGMFSLSGQPDAAMVEERVRFDDVFSAVTYKGVPDIRVIVMKGVPVAAMLRLPTSRSDGKANLHRGGVGAGIDLVSGTTTSAMVGNKAITHHPDTGNALRGVVVPHWKTILEMSARAYDMTGLGYLGADIVLDRDKGPLMLELNARPGLSIQIALGRGLMPVVTRMMDTNTDNLTVEQRVELAMRIAGEMALTSPSTSA